MSDILERYLVIENEDDLTRIVFGLLDFLGPSILTDVLELPSGKLSDEVTVEFHQRIDPRAERVPDVVIEDADTTILIEAKRRPLSTRSNCETNTRICDDTGTVRNI